MSSQRKRSRSLIVWLLLAVFVGGIIIVERSGLLEPGAAVDEHGETVTGPRMLLPAPVAEFRAIELEIDGSPHRFERDADGGWFHHVHDTAAAADEPHEHQSDPANSDLIGGSFAILERTRIAREVGTGVEGEDYGVTEPDMTITIYGTEPDRPLARYMVGDLEPDEFRRYVLISEASSIVTIPDYQIENLRKLIEAVNAPPR